MLYSRWSHGPPTYWRTVTPNWYWTRVVPKLSLPSSWSTGACYCTQPWNYNTNRNNMYENLFIKVFLQKSFYWLRHTFEVSRAQLPINKRQKISRYQITNVVKIWFLFLVFARGQKRNKSKFVTKFAGVIVTIIFI